MLLREEIMWRQCSRATYIREGDRNTKWIQGKATWRKKKNEITKLLDNAGVWKEDRKDIQEMMRQNYQNLYEEEAEVNPTEVLELMEKKVTDDMNSTLTKHVSAE